MKSNKAMGMIQLFIVTVLIIAIVSIGVYFIRMKYYETRSQTVKTDMLQIQWKIKDYIDKQTLKGEEKNYPGTKLSEIKENLIIQDFKNKNIIKEEELDKFYVLEDKDLQTIEIEITNYEGSYFLINYDTYEIMVTQGCNYSGNETLYKLSDIEEKSKQK